MSSPLRPAPGRPRPWIDVALVTATTFLITWLPLTSQFFVFMPWFSTAYGNPYRYTFVSGRYERTPATWDQYTWTETIWHYRYTWLLVFDFLVVMIWWNYALAVTTKPGNPPPAWAPPSLQLQKKETLMEAMLNTSPEMSSKERYCRICDNYKPPRAHHCRVCNRCILKMDHHCSWVGQCVGFRNQGHFVRFLFYAQVSSFMCFLVLIFRLISYLRNPFMFDIRDKKLQITLVVVNILTNLPVVLGLFVLFLYHAYYVAFGMTTLESFEKERAYKLLHRGRIRKVHFPYDAGIWRNLTNVLGRFPLLWFTPQPVVGDGVTFPATSDDPWPPMETGANGHTYTELDGEIDIGAEPILRPQDRPLGAPGDPRVRRGSEGYEVRLLSAAEREELVQSALARDDSDSDNGSAEEAPTPLGRMAADYRSQKQNEPVLAGGRDESRGARRRLNNGDTISPHV